MHAPRSGTAPPAAGWAKPFPGLPLQLRPAPHVPPGLPPRRDRGPGPSPRRNKRHGAALPPGLRPAAAARGGEEGRAVRAQLYAEPARGLPAVMGLRGAERGVRQAVTARGGGGGAGGGAQGRRLPPAPAAPRAGPAARPAAPAAVPGGAAASRRRSRPAPLFAVPPLPCAGLGWRGLPRALLAAAGAGAVALGRRRSEPLKAPRGGGEGGGRSGGGRESRTARGSQEQGRHVRLGSGGSPPGRRGGEGRQAAAEGPVLLPPADRGSGNWTPLAAALPRLHLPPLTLPPPGGGAAGGRRPRAPSSVRGRRRPLGSALPAAQRAGCPPRPWYPGSPSRGGAEARRPPPCAAAVPAVSRYPHSPPPAPGHQKGRAEPRWPRCKGKVKPRRSPGAWEAPRVRVPSCGFWGPWGVGAQRDTPQEGCALPPFFGKGIARRQM